MPTASHHSTIPNVEYLDKPWVAGGIGPNEFDCWGLVRHWWEAYLGHTLPEVAVDAASIQSIVRSSASERSSERWEQLSSPKFGCIVAMGAENEITHVGVFVGNSFVLHAYRPSGKCIISRLAQLRRQYQTLEFYFPNDFSC